ncbi:MAG: S1-like domain-containing RNA-binding protein [Bacteroidaceae bacterium]
MNIKLGSWNELTILRMVEIGAYLDGGEVAGDILIPQKYLPNGCQEGDQVEVFVYLDQDERLIATTETPKAEVGDFAFLQVAWINQYGAFLDWGLMKDLFVPFREQKLKMIKDKSYIVHVHIDEVTYRIVASAKIERYLSDEVPPYAIDDEVDVLVWQKTDLGFKVIVDNNYSGLLYENQIFRSIRTGDRMKAYVEQVRPDGKLDISLQRCGKGRIDDFSEVLFARLTEAGGFLPFTDKSEADDIINHFGVSKKTFKRAVGKLYKAKKILLEEEGIKLME